MNTVIKGTKTIEEYKNLKSLMEQRAKACYENHKRSSEHWSEGEIAKVWIDGYGNLAIEYESGRWWHYNEQGEWW